MNKKIKKSSIWKCDGCGGNMYYKISKRGLYCASCGNVKPVEDTNEGQKRVLDSAVLSIAKAKRNAGGADAVFKCVNCGADITLSAYEVAKKCPYCSSSNVSEFDEDDAILPNRIIKFVIDKDEVPQALKIGLKNKWFLPNMFKANPKPKEVQALYFPAFTFDADAVSSYKGILYKYVQQDGKSVRRTFNVKDSINTYHRNVVVECSSRLSQIQLNYVMPYRYNNKIDFKREYILGYAVERFSEDLSESKNKANIIMDRVIKDKILLKHEAEGADELKVSTKYSNELFDYCILPIYIINFEYKNKPYTAFMNGQTGKTGGKLPKSWIKITFAWLVGIVLVALIVILSMLGE